MNFLKLLIPRHCLPPIAMFLEWWYFHDMEPTSKGGFWYYWGPSFVILTILWLTAEIVDKREII